MTEENKKDLILIESDFTLTTEPEEIQPRDINMSELTQLADELDSLEAQISEKELELSMLKQARKNISEEGLPTLMEQAGVDTLKLTNGRKIEIKDFVDARITDPNVAFEWLRETNNESIIKNEINVSLGRGDDAIAQDIIQTLKEQYEVEAAVKVGIHNMTLKAFCRDALDNPELAETLPKKAFGIYQGKRAKIN
jgi:hypothetical protein